jgi:hypothetical protein
LPATLREVSRDGTTVQGDWCRIHSEQNKGKPPLAPVGPEYLI